MKKALIAALLLAAGSHGFAQQKPKLKHMTITLVDSHATFTVGHRANNMFITRDDTAQVQKQVDLNTHVKAKEEPAAYEQMLMRLLKPYFDEDWQLVTAAVEFVPSSNTEVFRYYLTKEE
ncbi:hypothetical protein DCC81_11745 [Chitinophaga parva]|uniref:Uncharacterized protein n=1 Tax=Chitinophaga parva TaxID=2169414 RepID=A0A2T7BFB7_9BACT|nr:hypothetical protein [Chitinophaga parva]PUZ24981.1 hypothetical protein DCC81_11745 [Chitinophaga parva]